MSKKPVQLLKPVQRIVAQTTTTLTTTTTNSTATIAPIASPTNEIKQGDFKLRWNESRDSVEFMFEAANMTESMWSALVFSNESTSAVIISFSCC